MSLLETVLDVLDRFLNFDQVRMNKTNKKLRGQGRLPHIYGLIGAAPWVKVHFYVSAFFCRRCLETSVKRNCNYSFVGGLNASNGLKDARFLKIF